MALANDGLKLNSGTRGRHMLAMAQILHVVIVVFLVLTPTNASAQLLDRASCSYRACAIRLEPGWGGPKLLQGAHGEPVGGLGMFRTNVAVLESSDSSRAYVAKFRRAYRTSQALSVIGGVGMIVFYHAARGEDPSNPLAVTSGIVGIVALYASLPYTLNAHRHLARAIWWHNSVWARE